MKISSKKTSLKTNKANTVYHPGAGGGGGGEGRVKRQKLGLDTSFKYLGAIVSDEGSKPEVRSRIAQATAFLTELKPI